MDTSQSPMPLRPRGIEDWEHHKETICHLYHDLGKPLREVSVIMRTKYDFMATNKQYKYRLKQWGVRKNLNTAELDQMQHYSATGREMRLPTVNGREIGSKRLKSLAASDKNRRAGRHYIAPLRVGVNHISDSFRTAEMDLRAATTHTMQQCEAASERTWRNPVAAPGCRWYGDMLLAILRLRGQSEVDAGFQLIDKCCAGYKTVLQAGDPLLLWFTYSSILELSQNGMNIAMAFATFVAGICAIEKGRTHPLTILLTNVLKAQEGSAYNRDSIAMVVEAQFDILVDKYEGAWKKLCLVYLRLTLQRLTGRGSPTQEQAVTCPKTLSAEDITQKGHTVQYPRKSRKVVPWMQMSKAMTFIDRGDYMRASMTLGDEGFSDASYPTPVTRQPESIRDLRAGIEDKLVQFTSTEKVYSCIRDPTMRSCLDVWCWDYERASSS